MNQDQYSLLIKMTFDILTIPLFTVACEFTFSVGSRVLDAFHRPLKPGIVKVVICLRDWLFDEGDDFSSPFFLVSYAFNLMSFDMPTFSVGGRVLDALCSSLKPSKVKVVIYLRDWLFDEGDDFSSPSFLVSHVFNLMFSDMILCYVCYLH